MRTFYELNPTIDIDAPLGSCVQGVADVVSKLASATSAAKSTIVLECYPGVIADELLRALHEAIPQALVVRSEEVFLHPDKLREKFAQTLGEDPVFAYMRPWTIDAYFDEAKLREAQARVDNHLGPVVIIGPGASRVAAKSDLLVYLSTTRWVLQARQRAHQVGNLGFKNATDSPGLLYKNAFFLDWRAGDALRHEIFAAMDWFVDLDDPSTPRMVSGDVLRKAMKDIVRRPFRVVPFFDPGPWGGQWMREKFGLPAGPKNYAWGFDCVPEENSVLLNFGGQHLSVPAQIVVAEEPEGLLGPVVFNEFGAEFPIRFDFLDTVDGGNLSLQVHPLREYIREHFGMSYTQDESYYIFESKPGSHMFLGLRTGVDRDEFAHALQDANDGERPLEAEQWVNVIPTHRHDHFSIPAGTVHCSGRDNVVLEISATPYIFTFKLWDWGRLGLDGKPRPVHLRHGLANIQWNRDTQWVNDELLQPAQKISEGDGWREERTGLHSLEFLETRRHWFTKPVTHNTRNNLHVLNLVEGDSAIVESPTGAFDPMIVHYGETFIVPAAAGEYTLRPLQETDKPLATIQAYVRTDRERNDIQQSRVKER
ncbi:class I mannose-6-phosphate isomerase [Terriglobus roseus]|uniref:Mannose-6-phosphate isomerase, class I n=1 Tax=Terriglobus roseus TaxID=392734 RepID=A0A1G7GTD5_9BACT|nr:class I mannose-6-phosphate isomerase [Terriglobus roseus]SDE91394.1 Mannose-6-phosphate isomerase, class I [Terriglobus roseus]